MFHPMGNNIIFLSMNKTFEKRIIYAQKIESTMNFQTVTPIFDSVYVHWIEAARNKYIFT